MLKRFLKNEKGLTLIELLVVIVILGIIAAIAIPAVGGLIENSKNDAKVAEGIQIISAAKLYVASEDVSDGDTLTKTQLAQYLDNVADDGYTVTVTKSADGNLTYSLSGHSSVDLAGSGSPKTATEAQLIAY